MKADTQKTPWGFECKWADTELYSSRMLVVVEGEQTPYIYHKKMDKTIIVLEGMVSLTVEGHQRQLEAGDTYHIFPKSMHKIHALKGDAMILETGTKLIAADTVVVKE